MNDFATSRRAFLGGLAAVPVVAALPTPVAAVSPLAINRLPAFVREVTTLAPHAPFTGNVILSPAKYANEALRLLHSKLVMVRP